MNRTPKFVFLSVLLPWVVPIAMTSGVAAVGVQVGRDWWEAGSGHALPAYATYTSEEGGYALLNADGQVTTKGHPFFEPLGKNGRACITCHQPANGMSLSAQTVRNRWAATQGKDPLFDLVDGANCPDALPGVKSSHSLMLDRGLVRIGLPWPPKRADGSVIAPEFRIEVVRDPTRCNTGKIFGLAAAEPSISVYRRPRVVANLRYLDQAFGSWSLKDGELLPKDAETGRRLGNNIMADTRYASLEQQAADAARVHLQAGKLSPEVLKRITGFERQLYGAMVSSPVGGSLREGGASAGPQALQEGKGVVVGGFTFDPAYPELEGWRTSRALGEQRWDRMWPRKPVQAARPDENRETPAQHSFRDSVARGYDLFMYRSFLIRDVGDGTDFGLGNPVKASCALCHNMQHMSSDSAPGFMDIGTTNRKTALANPGLPLFRLTCRKDVRPHPYQGRVIYTYDPGRALVSGRCRDIGAINMQQFRGLSVRAPYFSNGSARTLRDVVQYYEDRFHIGLSDRDKADLVNFLGVL